MNKIIVYLNLMLLCKNLFAYSDNLDVFLSSAKNGKMSIKFPDISKLESIDYNYKPIQINFFTKSRNLSMSELGLKSQDFNLNQLTVVGVMNYKNKEYAFLKTPYETIMVRAGDTIKTAKIIKINVNNIEFEEVQMQSNQVYKRKIYLKFDLRGNSNLISKDN